VSPFVTVNRCCSEEEERRTKKREIDLVILRAQVTNGDILPSWGASSMSAGRGGCVPNAGGREGVVSHHLLANLTTAAATTGATSEFTITHTLSEDKDGSMFERKCHERSSKECLFEFEDRAAARVISGGAAGR
jgi:hypothetical protein